MTNQWRIENVRNSDALKAYARDRNYEYRIASPKEYMTEDPREAFILIGLTWAEMVLLVDDMRDLLDVDCPPIQTSMFEEDESEDGQIEISFPSLESRNAIVDAEIIEAEAE